MMSFLIFFVGGAFTVFYLSLYYAPSPGIYSIRKKEENIHQSKPIDLLEYQKEVFEDNSKKVLNDRPVIAIVTQPTYGNNSTGFISASYVKWLESAGARSIPLPHDAPDSYTDKVFENVNGVLFTGGVNKNPPKAARRIYALAEAANIKFNARQLKRIGNAEVNLDRVLFENLIPNDLNHVEPDYFPIWGTCLGYEWMIQIGAGRDSILESNFDSWNITLPLEFTSTGAKDTQIFSDKSILDLAKSLPITLNNHAFGIEPDHFYADSILNSMYTVTSINYDRRGRKFVSTIEGIADSQNLMSRPYYGVQWHPEKNNFEYGAAGDGDIPMQGDLPYISINHSDSAVRLSFETARFFVKKTRNSSHRYKDLLELPLAWSYELEFHNVGAFEQILKIPS